MFIMRVQEGEKKGGEDRHTYITRRKTGSVWSKQILRLPDGSRAAATTPRHCTAPFVSCPPVTGCPAPPPASFLGNTQFIIYDRTFLRLKRSLLVITLQKNRHTPGLSSGHQDVSSPTPAYVPSVSSQLLIYKPPPAREMLFQGSSSASADLHRPGLSWKTIHTDWWC